MQLETQIMSLTEIGLIARGDPTEQKSSMRWFTLPTAVLGQLVGMVSVNNFALAGRSFTESCKYFLNNNQDVEN